MLPLGFATAGLNPSVVVVVVVSGVVHKIAVAAVVVVFVDLARHWY